VDKLERYPLQLYRKLALSIPGGLGRRRLLEVGSGRGGGLAHLARTQSLDGAPLASAVGGDLCAQQVALCSSRFAGPPDGVAGLRYVRADAESLPFGSSQFDVVINVESSHCYPDVAQFLRECERVLTTDGHLGIVDFRKVEERMALFESALHDVNGLTVIHEEDITPNVIAACEEDHSRRVDLIESNVHSPLKNAFLNFAGVADGQSGIFTDFKRGAYQYKLWVLQKTVGKGTVSGGKKNKKKKSRSPSR
jgi:ubiquinone/menaquinone biosynthesis C-methylase UbiE